MEKINIPLKNCLGRPSLIIQFDALFRRRLGGHNPVRDCEIAKQKIPLPEDQYMFNHVRKLTSGIKNTMSDEIIADRADRI